MKQVLIVEDDDSVRSTLRSHLKTLGYEACWEVDSGAAAVALAVRCQPDLVLMDIDLGLGMDGIDTAAQLKTISNAAIVFLSGYSDPRTVARAAEIAPFGFIVKPYKIQELYAVIETALFRRQIETKLRERERQLALIEHVGRIGVWQFDSARRRLDLSARSREILGFDGTYGDCLQFSDLRDRIAPTDRDRFAAWMESGSTSGERVSLDHPDGEQRMILFHRDGCVSDGSLREVNCGILQDVTAEERAAQKIQRSEDRFRALFEQAGVGAAELDPASGVLVEANQRLRAILGVDSASLGIREFTSFVADEYRQIVQGKFEAMRAGCVESFEIECPLLVADKKIVWIGLNATSKAIPPCREPREFIFAVEISERKRIHDAVKLITAAKAAGPDFARCTAVGLRRILGVDGIVIATLLDAETAKLRAAAFCLDDDILTDQNFDISGTPCERVITTGETLVIANGLSASYSPSNIFVARGIEAYIGAPILDTNFKAIGAIAVLSRQPISDPLVHSMTLEAISALVGTELERVHAIEQFQCLVSFAPDPVILVDKNGKIILVNERTTQTFGYDADEMIGQSIELLVPESSRGHHVSLRNGFYKVGSPHKMGSNRPDVRGRRKDGTIFPISVSLSPVRTTRSTVVAATVRDMTEYQKILGQLHESSRMDAIGKLTGGIAHDFNNLLAVILGNIELLVDDVTDHREELNAIERATRRGAELTSWLLSYSRRQSLRPKQLNLVDFVDGCRGILARSITEGIDILVHHSIQTLVASVDEGQLATALLNLAINARDAMIRGGKLTIATGVRSVQHADNAEAVGVRPGYFAFISVSDTGSGIASDILPKVFDPFFTTKEVTRGTGLGLSMVYGFTKQSGGTVEIATALDEGTTVTMLFPLSDVGVSIAPSPHLRSIPMGHGDTVFLIEDDPDVRSFLIRMIEGLGYRVRYAIDGKSALEQRDDLLSADVVLSDIVLPGGMDGFELIKQVREINPIIKVVLMSGYPLISDESADSHLASEHFLCKPFERAELGKTLQAVLSSTRVSSSLPN